MKNVELAFDIEDPEQARRLKVAEQSVPMFTGIRNFQKWLESKQGKIETHEVLTKLNFELESRGVVLDKLEQDE